MSAQEMQAQVIAHLLSTAAFADAHCTNPVPFDLAKGKFGPNLSEAIRTLSGEYLRQDDAVCTAEARIAELEAAIDKLAQVAHPGVQSLAEFKALVEVINKSLHK